MKLTVTPGQVIPPPPPPEDTIVIELTPAEAGVLRNILLRTFWASPRHDRVVRSVVGDLWEALSPWTVSNYEGPYQTKGEVIVGEENV